VSHVLITSSTAFIDIHPIDPYILRFPPTPSNLRPYGCDGTKPSMKDTKTHDWTFLTNNCTISLFGVICGGKNMIRRCPPRWLRGTTRRTAPLFFDGETSRPAAFLDEGGILRAPAQAAGRLGKLEPKRRWNHGFELHYSR